MSEAKAAIFDVDGTLVDSLPRYWEAWSLWAKRNHMPMTREEFDERYNGLQVRDIVGIVMARGQSTRTAEDLLQDYFQAREQVEQLERHGPTAIACVVSLAEDFAARKVPLFAASNGLRRDVEALLQSTGLSRLFPSERVLCAEDLPGGRGKPDPAIFLAAAKMMGVEPKDCVVFEDSEVGVRAATLAGCRVINVRRLPGYPSA